MELPMGKAWRWKKDAYKQTVSHSLLGKLIGDVFGGNEQPLRRIAGGGRSKKKSRQQSFLLEAIEPRLLLSADISYTTLSLSNDLTLKAVGSEIQLLDGGSLLGTKTISAGDT